MSKNFHRSSDGRSRSNSNSRVKSKTNKKHKYGYGQASGSQAFTRHKKRHNFNRHSSHGKKRNRHAKKIDTNAFINKAAGSKEGEGNLKPENLFSDFELKKELKDAVLKKGYSSPTPIQDRIIPHILKGKDVVGIANTGTGKTAAFLIPLINKVLNNPNEKVIIVTPTRELADQIHQEFKKLTPGMHIFSVCCVGGTSIVPQMRELNRRHNFVVGTPGRLKDLMQRKKLDLSEINTIVLDEADVMLDMGFIDDMRFLVSKMPAVRHTLFFSATFSKEIEKLIHAFLHNPVTISVKTQDTSKNVDQDVIRMKKGENKTETLNNLLIQEEFNKVLIFGRTKRGVENLTRDLRRKGFGAESIHGNKNYNQRQRALSAFKGDKVQILVATDVASRGLDIPNVSHVINYDTPGTYEDYVHRIGRTGRWGKEGKALTFV